jgi:hypothetical protein
VHATRCHEGRLAELLEGRHGPQARTTVTYPHFLRYFVVIVQHYEPIKKRNSYHATLRCRNDTRLLPVPECLLHASGEAVVCVAECTGGGSLHIPRLFLSLVFPLAAVKPGLSNS